MVNKSSSSSLNQTKKRSVVLRASEIGQFHYCSISWYLHRCGYQPKSPKLEVGEDKHKKLGQTINSLQRKEIHSKTLKYVAYILLIVVILMILGVVIL